MLDGLLNAIDFESTRSRSKRLAGTALNIAILFFLIDWTLTLTKNNESLSLILGLGIIGLWRHSWGVYNYLRAVRFRNFSKKKTSDYELLSQTQLVVIVTFYNQSEEDMAKVLRSLAEAFTLLPKRPLLIIAYRTLKMPMVRSLIGDSAAVQFVPQTGRGKREAIADALVVAKQTIPANSIDGAHILLIDGDTVVTPQAIWESMGVLDRRAEIGAVVVNEKPLTLGPPIFGVWRKLRSLQRHKMMMSMALSDRLLVLTGRFSMIRSSVLLPVSVASRIRHDYIQTDYAHIPFLTGDDKTTWLEVLRRGYGMTYLPNTFIYPIEHVNSNVNYFHHVYKLSLRYGGNMIRANLHDDAWSNVARSPHLKYTLIDQRVSMWTSLLSPTLLILLLVTGQFQYFIVFLTYLLIIKNVQAIAVGWLGNHYDPWFPYIIFADQFIQSLAKIKSFSFLHHQSWNNQDISLQGDDQQLLDRKSSRVFVQRYLFFTLFFGFIYVLLI